jgi:hypothetical protein
MKKFIILIGLFFVFTLGAKAQTACPPDLVCIPKATAEHFLKVDDENKALKAQVSTLQNSFEVAKTELHNTQIDLAKASTKATELEIQRTRDSALIEVLVKMVRPKKVGFINLF